MDFSEPYINAGQVLVVRKDSSAVKLADLSGKSVGAQIGTTGAFEIEKARITLKSYDELGFAMEDLVSGRIEGVVADAPTAAAFALQNEKYAAALKIVGEPFTDEYYGIAVRKGTPKCCRSSTAACQGQGGRNRQTARIEVAALMRGKSSESQIPPPSRIEVTDGT